MAENFSGITDTGRQRENNEDAFIAQAILNKQYILACVIDGVGGYEGGEVAAAIAKESILSSFKNSSADIIKTMQQAFVAANERIYKEKLESAKNNSMACVATLALADVKNNKFWYAHVGDTRLYLFRDHSLIKITKDQSFVGFLEDSGRITEEEAMKHPKRNEINKALGFETQSILSSDYIETGESPFLPGDTFLLCSDGLTDMVGSKEIASVLEAKISLEQKAKELIAAANQAGGKDNITVVLVQNNKRPVKQEVKKPVLVKRREMEKTEPPSRQTVNPKPEVRETKRRSNTGVIILLSLLCFVFLSGMVWMWWQKNNYAVSKNDPVTHERNVEEIRLQTFINASPGKTILLNEGSVNKIISLTDTIWVRRDSMYLKGSNLTLVKDSSFGNSVAIVLGQECKHIVLDSINFQGFDVAILASNSNSVQLKNVQFKNCSVAVAYKLPGDEYVNKTLTNKQQPQKDSLKSDN
jgi:PPM family protein phosphatase